MKASHFIFSVVMAAAVLSGCAGTSHWVAQPAPAPQAPHSAEPVRTEAPVPEPSASPAVSTLPTAPTADGLVAKQQGKSNEEIAKLIVVWVAGYCQGWADVTGGDFETCFDTTTSQTLAKLKQPLAIVPGKP